MVFGFKKKSVKKAEFKFRRIKPGILYWRKKIKLM